MNRPNSNIILACFPYVFALKEGRKFPNDMMDYSLMLLQRTCTECLVSPKSNRKLRAMYSDSIVKTIK